MIEEGPFDDPPLQDFLQELSFYQTKNFHHAKFSLYSLIDLEKSEMMK
jgi:hypothetical protein